MDKAAQVPVSLPQPYPTQSYWHTIAGDDHPILNHRTTPTLPSHVKYLIIGSGISGTGIAHSLLERLQQSTSATTPQTPEGKDPSILILEARTACSGATGRNGGHTKPSTYRTFPSLVSSVGLDDAIRMARLERANVLLTRSLAHKYRIKCDMTSDPTVDIFFDRKGWDFAITTCEWMNAHVSSPNGEDGDDNIERYAIFQQDEARRRFHCPEALGAVAYNAGSVSAFALVAGLLDVCIARGVNLQTNTPATSLKRIFDNGESTWVVSTPRGEVTAENVIFATNGYTAACLPPFQGSVVPLRGQITAQRPGLNLPSPLPTTVSFMHDLGYEYMITRPPGSKFAGDVVIGGGWPVLPDRGASEFGVTDDSVTEPRVGKYLRECTPRYYGRNWGKDDKDARVRQEWTGIMGASSDGRPFVGPVPGMKGVWSSVAFDGHGMCICLKCGEALVDMVLNAGGSGQKSKKDNGTEEVVGSTLAKFSTWFPRAFVVTPERLKTQFEGRRDITTPDARDVLDVLEDARLKAKRGGGARL